MLLVFIVVVIPGHNLGNSQVSVNRTIGPTLVCCFCSKGFPLPLGASERLRYFIVVLQVPSI